MSTTLADIETTEQNTEVMAPDVVKEEVLADPLRTSSGTEDVPLGGPPPDPSGSGGGAPLPEDNPFARALGFALASELTPEQKKLEEKNHRDLADNVGDTLKNTGGTRDDKLRQAAHLEARYTPMLRGDISLSIDFLGAPRDQMQDAQILIAPNDTRKKVRFSVERALVDLDALLSTKGGGDHTIRDGLNDAESEQLDGALKAYEGMEGGALQMELLLAQAEALLGNRKAREGLDIGENDPLNFLVMLSGQPVALKQIVVVLLGTSFGELLEKAGLGQLWKTEATVTAIVDLLGFCPDSIAQRIVQDLLKANLFAFDLAVDRFEARLAWELLLTLPDSQRNDLVTGDIPEKYQKNNKRPEAPDKGDMTRDEYATAKKTFKDDKEKYKDQKKAHNDERKDRQRLKRITPALSLEYRESSRYDTYIGDKAEAVSATVADANAQVERSEDAARINQESGAGDFVGESTDLQSMLSATLDPALWEDPARLRPMLKMVIQADQARFVAPMVAKYWSKHANMLIGLGFLEDGRFVEYIKDDTYITRLSRLLAGVQAIGDVFGVVGVLFLDKDAATLDLKAASDMMLGRYGVNIAEIDDGEKMDALSVLLGSASAVKTVMNWLKLDATTLYSILEGGVDAGSRIQRLISEQTDLSLASTDSGGRVPLDGSGDAALSKSYDKLSDDDPDNDPTLAAGNKMIVTQDDITGITALTIPMLPIAGQSAIIGKNTIKTAAAAIINAQLEIKLASATDNRRHVRARVGKAVISDMMMISPDDMSVISSLEVEGFHFEAFIKDAKPTTLLSRVLFQIQQAVISTLRMVPKAVGSIGAWAAAIGSLTDVATIGINGMAIMDSDIEQVGFGFKKVAIKGVSDSKGNVIDELSIGETELKGTFENTTISDVTGMSAASLLPEKLVKSLGIKSKDSLADLEAVRDRNVAEKGDLDKKYAEIEDKTSQRATVLKERIDWLAETIVDNNRRIKMFGVIKPQLDRAEAIDSEIVRLQEQLKGHQDLLAQIEDGTAKVSEDKLTEVKAQAEAGAAALTKQLDALSSEKMAINARLVMLQGAQVEGKIGGITASGVDWDGTSVGSVTTSDITFSGSTDPVERIDQIDEIQKQLVDSQEQLLEATLMLQRMDPNDLARPALEERVRVLRDEQAALKAKLDGLETAGGATASVESILIEDVAEGGSGRRDLQIPAEIEALEKQICALDDRLAPLQADEDGLDNNQIILLKDLTAQHDKLVQVRDLLWKELADLQPLLAEFAMLRARLADAERPLSDAERERYRVILETLNQPPTVTVESIQMCDISMSLSSDQLVSDLSALGTVTDGKSDVAGVTAGMTVGSVSISNVEMSPTSTYLEEGKTTIGSVELTGAGVSMDLSGGLGASLLTFSADSTVISDITTEGTSAIVARQLAQVDAELAQIKAQIPTLGEGQADQLKMLQERQQALQARRAVLLKRQEDRASLEAFIQAHQSFGDAFVDAEKIDRSRAYSLTSAEEALARINKSAAKAREDRKVAQDAVQRYAEARAVLVNQLGQHMGKIGDTAEDNLLAERAEHALNERDMADVQTKLDAVEALLKTWGDEVTNLSAEITRLEGSWSGQDKVRKAYLGLIGEAEGAGVDAVKAGLGQLSGLSAATMVGVAKSQHGGFEDTNIASVAVEEANVDIRGLGNVLGADKETGAWGGAVQLSGAEHDGKTTMVDKLTIGAVTQGDAVLLEGLELTELKGDVSVQMLNKNDMKVDIKGFEIKDVTLKKVDWQSPDYGLITDGPTTFTGISADVSVSIVDSKMTGGVERFELDTLAAPGMTVFYGDYVIKLGSARAGQEADEEAGKPEVKALSISNYDMTSYGFDDITVGALSTEGLSADLGAGMVVSAETMEVGSLSMGGMVTEIAKKDQKKGHTSYEDYTSEQLNKDAQKLGKSFDPSGGSPDMTFNRMEMSFTDLEATDLGVRMDELGIDMTIDKLAKSSMSGFYMDMFTGAYGFKQLKAPAVNLGPIHYEAGGMLFSSSDMKMSGVEIAAHGKMKFVEGTTQSPDFTILDHLSADAATISGLHYASTDASGNVTDLRLPTASMTGLLLKDYNVDTGAMTLSLDSLKADDLAVKMGDALTTSTIQGDFVVNDFSYDTLLDADNKVIGNRLDFKETSASNVEYSEKFTKERLNNPNNAKKVGDIDARGASGTVEIVRTELGEDGKPDKVKLNPDGTVDWSASKAVDGKKDAWEQQNSAVDTLTFAGIKVGNLGVGDVDWNTQSGTVVPLLSPRHTISGFGATGLNLNDVKVSGYTRTWMEEVSIGGELVPLPTSEMVISNLEVARATTKVLTYNSVEYVDGRRTETTAHITGGSIQNIQATDLKQAGGRLTDGRIDLGQTSATIDPNKSRNDTIKGGVEEALGFGGTISTGGLWIEISEGGDKTKVAFKDALRVSGASLSREDKNGALDITNIDATISGLQVELFDKEYDGKSIETSTDVQVGRIDFNEEADFEYFAKEVEGPDWTEELEKEPNEMSQEELIAAARTNRRFARILEDFNWETLLSSINGYVSVDVNWDTNYDLDLTWLLNPTGYVTGAKINTDMMDIMGSTVKVPIINGFINKEMIGASSDVAANILLSLLPMGTTIHLGGLAWLGGKGMGLFQDWAYIKLLKEVADRDKRRKQYEAIHGPVTDDEFNQLYDKVAEIAFQERVTEIKQLKKISEKLRKEGWEDMADDILEMYEDKSGDVETSIDHGEYGDLFLDNFQVDLTAGPLKGKDFDLSQLDAGDEGTFSKVSIDEFGIDFKDTGGGVYEAGLDFDAVSLETITGQLDASGAVKNSELTELGIGSGSLQSTIDELLPEGRFAIVGGLGEDQVKNPIVGSISADSYAEDLKVFLKTVYRK